MVIAMKNLDTIELPLNRSCLIEASAGTGKTHTIKNLYLRLLLGISHDDTPLMPLSVEQILVVTFTKAATEELKVRIRQNIQACYAYFKRKLQGQNSVPSGDEIFFEQLFTRVENKEEALLRLRIAEREIDLASVFTIHSFCQKMLFRFAFDSGVRFDIELQPNENEPLLKLAQAVWRELFYPMDLTETQLVADELKTPETALKAVRSYLSEELPPLASEQHYFNQPLADYLAAYQQFLTQVKAHWQQNRSEIATPILNELEKKYKTGVKKSLNRRSYQMRYVEKWLKELDDWAADQQIAFPQDSFSRFCQNTLNEKAEENAAPLESEYFAKNQHFLTAYQQQFDNKIKSILLYQFLLRLRQKVSEYKSEHSERSFDDLLLMLNQALKSERGEALAEQIRAQFPFAMIDEFQDTDQTQYDIFRQIFMAEQTAAQGFIMIGDPKQSIYKFRGADIFTYLEAAKEAQEQRTLDKNWRSLPMLVDCVNRLFSFPPQSEKNEQYAFLYQGIPFQAVKAKESNNLLYGSAEVNCYLQVEFNEKLAAEHCAAQIQQQLKAMQAGEFGLQNVNSQEIQPFAAKDIAILVRSKEQAGLVKQALAQRGIKSVFLSERSSVYQTEMAKELIWVLRACLNPYHQASVLNALGSQLWGLSAFEIYQLKHDERLWEKRIEQFIAYQQLWLTQGILPMLHQLFLQEGILQRLKVRENADRLLTDLFHLAELLQSGAEEVENEAALVRWYERNLANQDDLEAYTLRLESEEELIKIVTIHGSKGLQYPIVWLPFIGKNSSEVKASALSIYRDEQAHKHWDFNGGDPAVAMLKNQAEFAEDLRLLYVALTRAESQLNWILPQEFKKGWNGMHYLLSNGELGLGGEAMLSTENYLQAKEPNCKIFSLDEKPQFDDWRAEAIEQEELSVRSFEGEIKQKQGQLTSFTALYRYHETVGQYKGNNGLPVNNELQDYDLQFNLQEAEELAEVDEPNMFSAYQFPHSAKVGNVLHRFFEHWDFQQAVEKADVFALCEQLNLTEEWVEPVCRWFEQIRSTPFGDKAFSLSEISSAYRLNEWQFFLRLKNDNALSMLNKVLRENSRLAAQLPPLHLPELAGFVRGFVDCITQVDGQFYIFDYKSNFLGYLAQDYSAENLAKTMGLYRYDLQYLLYTLALHRYLTTRLGAKYDYERDFGGVAYLFLRGMNGTPQSGVYFDKPKKALVEQLDELFQ